MTDEYYSKTINMLAGDVIEQLIDIEDEYEIGLLAEDAAATLVGDIVFLVLEKVGSDEQS